MKRNGTLSRAAAGGLVALAIALAGCSSTRGREDEMEARLDEAQARMEKIETEEQDFDQPAPGGRKGRTGGNRDSNGVPIPVTALPAVTFSGRGIKVEFEDMLLTRPSLFADAEASSGYAARLADSGARAEFSIRLPAGRYECLLSEKARDADHAAVSVSVGKDSFTVYPSNPPLGIWELTTRTPIYVDVAEEQDFLVSVSSDVAGMGLDYIQFVRME